MLARKSVKQRYSPTAPVLVLMQEFRCMVNDCIRIGLENDCSTMKRLSSLAYRQLGGYQVPSYYKLCAISKAAGILASRKKSIRRGFPTKDPCLKRPMLTSCYGFRIEEGKLRIPTGNDAYEHVTLNPYTLRTIAGLKVNSFTLTDRSLSLCISKKVQEMKELASTIGVDRNLRNLAVGNEEDVRFYDMNKVVRIGEATSSIIRSFRRNDVRIRRRISAKYGLHRWNRVRQALHMVSKRVVADAKEKKQAIVFEDIREIRRLYGRGNGQGRAYRRRMNSWPFAEIKRQIEYKARWEGVPIMHLTKSETRGTSSTCFQCGERLQGSKEMKRKLWCQKCRRMFDRDAVAVVNIARRGWVRFAHSQGEAIEAMVGVCKPSVDAPKSTIGHAPIS